MDDFRLAGEDDFFQPNDLGFVAQPAAPVVPVAAAPAAAPVAAAPALTPTTVAPAFNPPAGWSKDWTQTTIRGEDIPEVTTGTYQLDPNFEELFRALGFQGPVSYQERTGEGDNIQDNLYLTPEAKQFVEQGGYQLVNRPGQGGQYFSVADPTGKLLVDPIFRKDPDDKAIGIVFGLLNAGAASLGLPVGLLNAAAAADQGNALGALTSLAGGIAGLQGVPTDIANVAKTVSQAGQLARAVESRDPLGVLASGTALTGTTDIGGMPVKDILNYAKVADAVAKGDTASAVLALGNVLRAGQTGDRPAGASELSKTSFLNPDEILSEPVVVGMSNIELLDSILGPTLAGESELSKTKFLDEDVIAGGEPTELGSTNTDLVESILGPTLAGSSELAGTKFLDEDKIVADESVLGTDAEDALAGPSELSKTKFLDEDVIASEEPAVVGSSDEELVKTILGEDKTTAPAPKVSAPAPAPAPAPPPASKDLDLAALFALLGGMGAQQAPVAQYQTANVAPGVQAGLKAIEQMYGTRRG